MARNGDGKKQPPSVATNLMGRSSQFAPMALLNRHVAHGDSVGLCIFYAPRADDACLQPEVVLV